MPDITMCEGVVVKGTKEIICPKRTSCYRYKAIPTPHWQSYFSDMPYDFDKKDCDFYERIIKETNEQH